MIWLCDYDTVGAACSIQDTNVTQYGQLSIFRTYLSVLEGLWVVWNAVSLVPLSGAV